MPDQTGGDHDDARAEAVYRLVTLTLPWPFGRGE